MCRTYQPIWTKLKLLPRPDARSKGISVTAPRTLHRRIVKAVIKEKYMDLGFKLQIEPRTCKIKYSSKGSIIKFTLVYKPTTVEDF